MDPLATGAIVVGVTIIIARWMSRRRSRPAKTSGWQARTRGASGRLPRDSWLVKAWNSSGARQVDSDDLKGATAEVAGWAAGGAARRSRRRWTVVKTAAARSRDRREKRWQETGRTPLLYTRQSKPKADPKPKTESKPEPKRDETKRADTPKPPEPPKVPKPDPPKRHLNPVPDPPTRSGETVTADTTAPTTVAAHDVPPDWALMNARVRSFVPEDDAALLAFMKGEVAGAVDYADGLEQARENCTNDVGLDPSAVAGLTAYSDHMSEATERMAEAWQTFVAVYGEVQQLAASGVTMPHNGRFWTGAAG